MEFIQNFILYRLQNRFSYSYICSLVCASPSHKFIFISNYETICPRWLTASERIIYICGERKDALSQAFRMLSPSDLVYRRSALKAEQDSPLQERAFAYFLHEQKVWSALKATCCRCRNLINKMQIPCLTSPLLKFT